MDRLYAIDRMIRSKYIDCPIKVVPKNKPLYKEMTKDITAEILFSQELQGINPV